MANPLICVFNPVTLLIDEIPASSIFTGAGAAGTPVVLNLQGFIDPSLLGVGTHATAGEILNAGALVNLYNSGGSLFMQNAYAAAVGTSPSGAPYPVPAVAFVANNVSINNTAQILFSGVLVYGDPNSEFSASDIGAEVFLSQITPGGVTKTRPSGPGQAQQSVGTVVGFTAPNFVQVAFVVQPQPQFNNFNNLATGTNTTAIMTVGTGATLNFSGTGVVNANEIYGVVVSAVAPSVGQVLTATSPTAANWQTPAADNDSFSVITSGTNSAATMTVDTGASIVVTGTGVVEATQIQAVIISAVAPSVGQVLTATSATAANWQATTTTFAGITSGTNSAATMTVGTGASIVVSGTGVVEATELATTGAPVVVSAAAPPTAGQVLTATSATTAAWSSPGSPFIDKAQRFGPTLVNSGTLSSMIVCTFTSAFADNNYTAEVSSELGEALSTAGLKVAGFTKQAAGAGLNVWVENNDSINHNVTIHVFARHD